jgi:hypothetical protein
MNNDEIPISDCRSRFVLQRGRDALDKVEETVAAGLDVCAVLDVIRRPVTLRFGIVALTEQRLPIQVGSLGIDCREETEGREAHPRKRGV